MEIQKIGTVMEVDDNGNLVNEAGIDKIQDKWRGAVDDFVTAVKENLGEKVLGIYIRGSVAKGKAIDDVSDLDTITILDVSPQELPELDFSWRNEARDILKEKYPFQEKIEFQFLSKDDLTFGDTFILKTQSVCVEGEDITKDWEPIKLTDETIMKLRGGIQDKLDRAVESIKATDDASIIERDLKWICKRFLRRGMLFVAIRANAYTRDLYPSYELFSKYYPEKEPEMRQALEYALNPVSDKKNVLVFIESFGNWIIEEDRKLFE